MIEAKACERYSSSCLSDWTFKGLSVVPSMTILALMKKNQFLKIRPLNILLNARLNVSKDLLYLHEVMKVAHRDLSSNNILLAADLSAKIADLAWLSSCLA